MKNLLTKQERNQYAEEHFNLVYHVAKSFFVSESLREELHGAGFVGLTKALNTYDKELKVAKFSTYACTCITNEILQFLRHENKKEKFEMLSIEHSYYDNETGSTFESDDYHEKFFVTEDHTLENMIAKEELEEAISIVDTFKPQMAKVVKMRHGISTGVPMTQTEVANKLGTTQASVSKIEKESMRKLKTLHTLQEKIRA